VIRPWVAVPLSRILQNWVTFDRIPSSTTPGVLPRHQRRREVAHRSPVPLTRWLALDADGPVFYGGL